MRVSLSYEALKELKNWLGDQLADLSALDDDQAIACATLQARLDENAYAKRLVLELDSETSNQIYALIDEDVHDLVSSIQEDAPADLDDIIMYGKEAEALQLIQTAFSPF